MAASKNKTNVGISITQQAIEGVVFSTKELKVERALTYPMPPGVLNPSGDIILEPLQLGQIITSLIKQLKPNSKWVNLSIPATMLRVVEMPKMQPNEMYLSLSTEAEGYKAFDGTEAVLDFCPLEEEPSPGNRLRKVVLGSVRKDTLATYLKIMQAAKVKVASVDLEPLNILRGMAGTGVLDSLVQQIGVDAYWGTIFVESERLRFSVWQGNKLVALRETHVDITPLLNGVEDPFLVQDIVSDIERTAPNTQPMVWLSHNMPTTLEKHLTESLNVPLRPCPLGPALNPEQTQLQVSSIGTALQSAVQFPFEFNLLKPGQHLAGPAVKVPTVSSPIQGEPKDLFITGGVALLGLAVVTWLGLMGWSMYLSQQKQTMETKQKQALEQLNDLQKQLRDLEGTSTLETSALSMMQTAQQRNYIYVQLAEDLKQKTPPKVWINHITVGDTLVIEGKALSHQSVIDFARNFDSVPYTSAVMIHALHEDFIGSTTVFDFEINGQIHLKPIPMVSSSSINTPENP